MDNFCRHKPSTDGSIVEQPFSPSVMPARLWLVFSSYYFVVMFVLDQSTNTFSLPYCTNAELLFHSKFHKLQVLIVSRVAKSFLDLNLAKELGIPAKPLPVPQEANTLDRCLLCRVARRTHSRHNQDGPQLQ